MSQSGRQNLAHCLRSIKRTEDVMVNVNVTFESLKLRECTLKGLRDCGFKKPSPIQLKAIPMGRCGFDIMVKSKSGTGKTLVYSVIALESINIENHHPQVLILSPTREISVQIRDVIINIGSHFKGLKVESFIGGLPLEGDRSKCTNCHIAVGAPGRVKHLLYEKILELNSIRLLVLDEVDKLMDSSFVSDINDIFNKLPERKQVITTSATYNRQLYVLLRKYMLSPINIEIETDSPLLLGLKQFVQIIKPYTNVTQEIAFKNEEILRLFSNISFTQCLIFTNYQTRAESINNFLNQNGWSSLYISAAKCQKQRLKTIKDLTNFECKILVCTDLIARGIDVSKVDLVINYDLPNDTVIYLHRMGRAGRYGSSGICIDFVSNGAELDQWQYLIGLIGGCSLGIPKLPKVNGNILDLLNLIITSEDCIFGKIPETFNSQISTVIKKKVLDLKQINFSSNKENTDGEVMDNSEFSNSKLLTSSNYRTKRECKILKPKEHNSKDISKYKLYNQSKALLHVSQILSTCEFKPDYINLQYYINEIKNFEKNDIYTIMAGLKSKQVNELLRAIDMFDYIQKSTMLDENNEEMIFKIAFHCAIKYNSQHWSSYLPNEEQSRFENLRFFEQICKEKPDILNESNKLEHIYTEEINTAKNFERRRSKCDSKLKNDKILTTSTKKKQHGNNRYALYSEGISLDHLTSHFNLCDNNLWQTGLSFKYVKDFDNWFYEEWQFQVFGVRDYIQQNLYIEEMNNCQNIRK